MFDNLIESKPRRTRTTSEMVVSITIHGVLITGAAVATRSAAETVQSIVRDTTSFLLQPPPPPPTDQPVLATASTAPVSKGFQTIVPPDQILTHIPPVDLTERFNPADYTGRLREGGRHDGTVISSTRDSITGERFTSEQVDEPAAYRGGPVPRYPVVLKAAGVQGAVELEFVVDATGRVETTSIRVITSSNSGFDASAIEAVSKSSFSPARIGGQRVRQLVRQEVKFSIEG